MIEQEFTQLISNVGFPIGMCIYLIFRFEKKLCENSRVIRDLHTLIKFKLK